MCSLEYSSSNDFTEKINLKFLNNNDIESLKRLCSEWFPIKYPDAWYKEVTNNPKFFTLAATYNNETIGVIVAEIRTRYNCSDEDSDILGYWYPDDTTIAYILILGAAKEFRRKGVASFLLKTFMHKVQRVENNNCKVVYLHVLSTNVGAVIFYERHQFRRHKLLRFYYCIQGKKLDGFCYVYYVNDGSPPWQFTYLFTSMIRSAL